MKLKNKKMENLKKIYSDFEKILKDADIENQNSLRDLKLKEKLIWKNIDYNIYNTRLKLIKYIQDLIYLFESPSVWNELSQEMTSKLSGESDWNLETDEDLKIEYKEEISQIFEKWIRKISIDPEKRETDVNEWFLEEKRKEFQGETWIDYDKAVSDLIWEIIKK